MESTGVYWIPLFELLERRGFTVLVVNAVKRHQELTPRRHSEVTPGLLINQFELRCSRWPG